MKVLVVGGAGYIGGAVTDLLLRTAHAVRVYDALLYEESYRKPVDFVRGDIRDDRLLRRHLEWADAVVWLAALVGDGACALNPHVSVEINQDSVAWLAHNFDGRIIFTSTCSVYGAQDGELTEDAGLNPLSVYAATKLGAEKHLQNRNAIIFRLGTLFGVGDRFSRIRLDLVVNILTVRASVERKVTVFGGEQFRPLLHVSDAAQAIVQGIDAERTGIFNLHHLNERIVDLADRIGKHFPDIEIRRTAVKFQDCRNYRVRSDRARRHLGWRSLVSVDEGIMEIRELVETGRIKDITNPRYTNETFLAQSGIERSTVPRQFLDMSRESVAEVRPGPAAERASV